MVFACLLLVMAGLLSATDVLAEQTLELVYDRNVKALGIVGKYGLILAGVVLFLAAVISFGTGVAVLALWAPKRSPFRCILELQRQALKEAKKALHLLSETETSIVTSLSMGRTSRDTMPSSKSSSSRTQPRLLSPAVESWNDEITHTIGVSPRERLSWQQSPGKIEAGPRATAAQTAPSSPRRWSPVSTPPPGRIGGAASPVGQRLGSPASPASSSSAFPPAAAGPVASENLTYVNCETAVRSVPDPTYLWDAAEGLPSVKKLLEIDELLSLRFPERPVFDGLGAAASEGGGSDEN